jgi:hypothetical protein
MEKIELIKAKYEPLKYVLNEKSRRLWSAGEAKALGWGGVSVVSRATGLSRTTITTVTQTINTWGLTVV